MKQTTDEKLEELDQRIADVLKESSNHFREAYYLNNW